MLKRLSHGIRQVHGLATEVDPGQAVLALEVLDHMPVVAGDTDLRNAEEADEFFLGHDRRAGAEGAV